MRLLTLAGIFSLGLCSLLRAAPPTEKAAAELLRVNQEFLAAHNVAKGIDLRDGGPIILVHSGQMTLLRHGVETTVNATPAEFDTFKTFSHLPVTIFLMLGSPGTGELSEERLQQLSGFRSKLETLRGSLHEIGLTGEQLERQQQILEASIGFLRSVASERGVSEAGLLKFTRSQTPLIELNLADAARVQLDLMNQHVQQWRQQMTPDEWKTLRVVIRGAALARDQSLASQYFEKLLHLPGEGTRIVYMERYFEPTPMLTLLATKSVDQQIGIAVFDDPERMFRDVLAKGAAAHLEKMKLE